MLYYLVCVEIGGGGGGGCISQRLDATVFEGSSVQEGRPEEVAVRVCQ